MPAIVNAEPRSGDAEGTWEMRQAGDVGEAPRPTPRQLSGTLADPIYLSTGDEVLVDSPDEGKGPGSEITIKQRHAALLAARRGITRSTIRLRG